jgi:hypothetical protein
MNRETLPKFTAGPWAARYIARAEPVIIQADDTATGGVEIARVTAAAGAEPGNARLIAAAPELLDACLAVLERLDPETGELQGTEIGVERGGDTGNKRLYEQLTNAVAKFTGG